MNKEKNTGLGQVSEALIMGAITGDIVGSRFEMENYHDHQANKTKDFELFVPECRFTDDTVMTVSVMRALLDCEGNWTKLGASTTKAFREIGRQYPDCGFGRRTLAWVLSDDMEANYSYGNGAAMRVSPCGYVGKTLDEVKLLARTVTEVTHTHPEAVKGAEAVAVCIYLAARLGQSRTEIRDYIHTHYYPLDFTLNEIRKDYAFEVSCQGSVPQGITAFLESTGFEDAIRSAISIGGDSDTLAAIAGGIAEPYYCCQLSSHMRLRVLDCLDSHLERIIRQFGEYVCRFPQQPGWVSGMDGLTNQERITDIATGDGDPSAREQAKMRFPGGGRK